MARPGLHRRELWQARAMIRFFGIRLLRKRYARTKLGWAWIPLRPVLDVGARAFLFGSVLSVPSGGVPYPLFLMASMTVWVFMERTLFWAVRSIELNQSLAKKIYFPRVVLPISAYVPSCIEFGVYVILFAIAIVAYAGIDGTFYLQISPELLLALVAFALIFALTFGLALILSVMGAQTRDVRFSLHYVLQALFFITPVAIPVSSVPESYRAVINLNPVSAPIELFRQGVFGSGHPTTESLVTSLVAAVVLCAFGLWFFARSEAEAVDNI